MGEVIVDQDSQGQRGQASSISMRFIFVEPRVQLTRTWKEEGFFSLYYSLLMCEMMDPSTFNAVRLACVRSQKVKYER